MYRGLSQTEAEQRLLSEGANELPRDARPGVFGSLLGILRQPMFILMILAGGVYLGLGDPRDALSLLAAVAAVAALTLYQQRRTERAVSELGRLTAPTARVLRDGTERSVPSREVVRDDIVLLREGDRVPADGIVLDCTNLRADESLLTGESVHLDKLPGAIDTPLAPAGRDDERCVYAGTLIVRGSGSAVTRATGVKTAIGAIGAALSETSRPVSGLQADVDRAVRRVALGAAALCVVSFAAHVVMHGDYLQGLLAGLTLAMAILPEEFPVVLTVFTLLGAFRIAKRGVLARRPESIEALGSATVLCVDKTGTITENKMRVAELCPDQGEPFVVDRLVPATLPEHVHEVLEFGILASSPDSFDPMERALQDLGARTLRGTTHLHRDYRREREYPLTRELLAVTHVWHTADAHGHVVAAKGAPEAIADLCHLSPAETQALLERVAQMAERGLRVLAVAHTSTQGEQHPEHPHAFEFVCVGLLGFEDPVRSSVPAALKACERAAVRVVMITGDHAATAMAIARQAGLDVGAGVMTGEQLAALDDPARRAAAARINVFARATPEHKLLIVRALQASGQLVAMTGDGVNDAPALKVAHVGIAMGSGATDVAREAAALVVTNEDFGVIADGILLGRRVFENLRKSVMYIIAVHVPIAAAAVAPVLLGLPAVLFPIHVLFLELVIDPACSIALEAEQPDPRTLAVSPRAGGAVLFARRDVIMSLVQGSALACAVLVTYLIAARELSEAQARATAFVALVVGNLALILVQRSSTRSALATLLHSRNLAADLLSAGALTILAITLLVPAARELFHFALPPISALAGAAAAAIAVVFSFDLGKLRRRGLSTAAR